MAILKYVLIFLSAFDIAVKADEKMDFGGFGGGSKSCAAYKCSKGFEPAPQRSLKFTGSGYLHV